MYGGLPGMLVDRLTDQLVDWLAGLRVGCLVVNPLGELLC